MSDEQNTNLLSMGLQTIGGVLLAVIGFIVKQISDKQKEHDKKLEEHADRLTKSETEAEGMKEFIREIREDIKQIKTALIERR